MAGVTYDAGALVAAERDQRAVWALHRRTLERGARPSVPAGVLGQVWRGGPQAALSRFLKGCTIEVLDEKGSRSAGRACGRSRTTDVVDATVVVGAIERGDLVVTSDPGDIRHLASALHATVEIFEV